MNNRDVAISACSVLLGALLGVGSILYAAEEVALSAIDPNAIRDGSYRTAAPEDIDGSQYNKRAITQNRVKSSQVVEKAEPVRRAAPVVEEVNGDDPVCAQIEDILSALRAQVLWLVGDDFEKAILRKGLAGAFDTATEAHGCGMTEEEADEAANGRQAAPSVRIRVDNNCDDLSPRRGTQCRAYEKAGIPWEPSQGIDR
ncbi:hypothetical protein HYZ98_04845 [Candidatus Peregrinibacteria bacterium]|nr:hypothetical protein [Candidatus Peregrinibacteria bacterium]